MSKKTNDIIAQIIRLEQENADLEAHMLMVEQNQIKDPKQTLLDQLTMIEEVEKDIDVIQTEILTLEYENWTVNNDLNNLQPQAFEIFCQLEIPFFKVQDAQLMKKQEQKTKNNENQIFFVESPQPNKKKEQEVQQFTQSAQSKDNADILPTSPNAGEEEEEKNLLIQQASQSQNKTNFFPISVKLDQSIPRISNIKEIGDLINIDKERMENLAQHYSHFREVRNDGNQFYRSVGFSLLEYFIQPTTRIKDVKNLVDKFKESKNWFKVNQQFQSLRVAWINTLE